MGKRKDKGARAEHTKHNYHKTRETVSTTGDSCMRYGRYASKRATLVRAEFEGKTRIEDARMVLKVFFSLSKRMTRKD